MAQSLGHATLNHKVMNSSPHVGHGAYLKKKKKKRKEKGRLGGSVKHLTSAQVMISQLVSSSPVSGCVLTARSLEPASDSVSHSLSLPLPRSHSVSLSKNKH